MKNHSRILTVVCLLKLLSWSSPAIAEQLTVNSDQLTTDTPSIQNLKLRSIASEARQPKIQNPLPCLDSSKECVEELTQRAIAHSSKLKTLDDRIALIDKRLGISKDSIDYAESKLWTNYLPSSTSFGSSVLDIINPLAWIKNLAGGGEMQRDRIAIADLEVKGDGLRGQLVELESLLSEKVRELGQMTGYQLLGKSTPSL
ncbi:MAG: hypothetical protein O9326_00055 [Microcystis sp. LE19-338.1B]|jgi:hypothetical protein|nr:hypothetical protein [Microcystis sp. LE19-338.1B]MCZ8357705.1 hypothetical protein [Microcystis sp. LE19-388.1G]